MQAFDDKKAQKTSAEQFYQMQFAIILGADRIPNLTGSQLQRNQPSFQSCHESRPTGKQSLVFLQGIGTIHDTREEYILRCPEPEFINKFRA